MKTTNVKNIDAIRDRTKHLAYNVDSSQDIYIQANSPGPGKESNWLTVTKMNKRNIQGISPQRSIVEE